jgi:hypothetical protein
MNAYLVLLECETAADLRSVTPRAGALLMAMNLPTTSQYLNGVK